MIDLGRLLERIAFHIPYSHDWLAVRDGLRNKNHLLQGDLARVEEEESAVQDDSTKSHPNCGNRREISKIYGSGR